jgi:hypothetical protein
MAVVNDDDDDDDFDDAQLGEVPQGLGADLYPKHLEHISRQEAFGEGVLSFRDAEGAEREIPLDEVAGTEETGEGSTKKTKIVLRNGAIVVATGAVIAAAIATVRYRRKHKG